MTVNVLFFGALSDLVSSSPVECGAPEGSTVGDLRQSLMELHAGASGGISTAMVAVNREYADDDDKLEEGDEVAFLPPVSGG